MSRPQQRHRPATLILGVGNVLLSDDGVGVRAVEALADLLLPHDVEAVDAGTGALEMACILEGRRRVIVLDAVDAGRTPGLILRWTTQQLRPEAPGGMSLHDFHLLDALQETQLLGSAPDEVIVLAVQVADVSPGLSLTSAVENALPALLQSIVDEIERPLKTGAAEPPVASM